VIGLGSRALPHRGPKFAFILIVINARTVRVLLWLLAVIVPGGLVALALWASVQGVRTRMSLRPPAETLPHPPRSSATAT
jgi:hypothetical protein